MEEAMDRRAKASRPAPIELRAANIVYEPWRPGVREDQRGRGKGLIDPIDLTGERSNPARGCWRVWVGRRLQRMGRLGEAAIPRAKPNSDAVAPLLGSRASAVTLAYCTTSKIRM